MKSLQREREREPIREQHYTKLSGKNHYKKSLQEIITQNHFKKLSISLLSCKNHYKKLSPSILSRKNHYTKSDDL